MPFNPLDALKRARTPQPELETQLGEVTQSVMPMLPGPILASLKGLLRGRPPARLPPARQAGETLGEVDPYFTPVGGEGLFNVARGGIGKATSPVEAAYQQLMSKLGGTGR